MSEIKKAVCRVIPDSATIAGFTWNGIRERLDCPQPKQTRVQIDSHRKLCLTEDNGNTCSIDSCADNGVKCD